MANLPNQPLAEAVTIYTAALPRQARLLSLAGEVLQLLAQVRETLPPAPTADLEEAALRLAAGETILGRIAIPETLFRTTLGHLLEIYRRAELLPPLPPERVSDILTLSPQTWLDEGGQARQLPEIPKVPANLLVLLARQALSPFYQQAAAPFLEVCCQSHWQQGHCPCCGQEPALGALDSHSGQRLLYCSLCRVEWPFSRLACSFCGRSQPRFTYVFVENDPARRADLCPDCGRYLKTLVTGRLPHLLFLPLEEFVTVDLDALMARGDIRI